MANAVADFQQLLKQQLVDFETGPQRELLELLGTRPEVPVVEVLQSSGVGVVDLATAVKQLEAKGYVETGRGDQGETVALTDVGRQLLGASGR